MYTMISLKNISQDQTLNIGIIGDFQSGKSLLVNCLLQRSIATVGEGNATTHTIIQYRFSQVEHIEYCLNGKNLKARLNEIGRLDTNPNIDKIEAYVNCDFLKDFVLIDMPGLDFDPKDDETSTSYLRSIDYAVVVAKNVHSISNYDKALSWLKKYDIPYYFVINCTTLSDDSRWNPNHRDNLIIAEKNFEYLNGHMPLVYPFEEGFIPIINLMWYWLSINNIECDELLQKYKDNFKNYGLLDVEVSKNEIEKECNFNLIKQIFSMENKLYLTLRKDIKDEIQKIKEELCPVGTIQAFAFQNMLQEGWLFCDGERYKIDDYPDLYHSIGNVFDSEDTPEGYFCVPDLQGQFIRGWDMSEKIDPKHEFGGQQEDALQVHGHEIDATKITLLESGSHTHKVPNYTWKRPGKLGSYDSYEVSSAGSYSTETRTSMEGNHQHRIIIDHDFIIDVTSLNKCNVRVANETRPKNIALLYCIKAK